MVTTVTAIITPTTTITDICTPWFTYDGLNGANCIGAYNAVGALSLADSYINRANPGTYDCAAHPNAPSWNVNTGWTLNGTNQALLPGFVVGGKDWTIIIRYANAVSKNQVGFGYKGAGEETCYINPSNATDYAEFAYGNASPKTVSSKASGVLAISNRSCYMDGVLVETLAAAGSYTSNQAHIAESGLDTLYYEGDILAVAAYDISLSAEQIAALTIAMNALSA